MANAHAQSQSGFSLIELMASVSLLAIVSVGSIQAFTTAATIIRGSDRYSVQSQLALNKLEEFAAIPASNLAAGESIEKNLKVRGMTFDRTTQVASFADGKRQVTITVAAVDPGVIQPPISYQGIFYPWGLR